jgi:hypothetical protein
MSVYLFSVQQPMIHPVPARAGDGLVVRVGHPTRPIVVVRRLDGKWRPVRVGPPNYGALIGLEEDGVISLLLPRACALRQELQQSA